MLMEPLIFVFWILLVAGVPLMLIVSAFIGYRKNSDALAAAGFFTLGLIVHVTLVAITFWWMFFLIFAGAHTEPVGNALSTFGRILWLTIEILYALIWFSISSLIAGRPRPWPLRVVELT